MSRAPAVTVIVVVYGRTKLVQRCLETLVAQTEDRFEVVVVLNGASAEVGDLVAEFEARDARIRPLRITRTTASEARNAGVRQASAPLLYFLDDDVEIPPHGLGAVIAFFERRPEIAIAGGPNLTPPDDPEFCQMAGELLGSPFGTGITHYRYSVGHSRFARERHLTLCNLAMRRGIFEGGTWFPRAFGGEENVLMGRAGALGHRFWYAPELWVFHRRRAGVRAYAAQVYRYGFGRAIAIRSAPGTFHPAFFAPVALVAALVAGVPAAATGQNIALAPVGAYALLAVVASAAAAKRRRRPWWLLRMPLLFALTHVAYAIGLLAGLSRVLRGKARRPDASALDTG